MPSSARKSLPPCRICRSPASLALQPANGAAAESPVCLLLPPAAAARPSPGGRDALSKCAERSVIMRWQPFFPCHPEEAQPTKDLMRRPHRRCGTQTDGGIDGRSKGRHYEATVRFRCHPEPVSKLVRDLLIVKDFAGKARNSFPAYLAAGCEASPVCGLDSK